MTKLLVGTDPEFFLINGEGVLKSAIGIVEGTKEEKIDLGNGHKLFYDNVLAEVNITPGDSPKALVANIQDCLKKLRRAVYPYNLLLKSSATFPEKECEYPDAKRFGCEPELCAYAMDIVQAPECTNTFRSAGGHIHLGYAEDKAPLMTPIKDGDASQREWDRVWVVRMMDLFLGLPSLWIDSDPSSVARRKLYGKAGTHRQKDYGVEYRATSNFWLRSPATVTLIYNISEFVVNFVADKQHTKLWKDEETCNGYDVNALREAINNSDKKLAEPILNNVVKKLMPKSLFNEIMLSCEKDQKNFPAEWDI